MLMLNQSLGKQIIFSLWFGLSLLIIAGAGSSVWAQRIQPQPGESGVIIDQSARAAEGLVDRRAYHYYVNAVLSEGLGDHFRAAQAYRKAWEFFPESFEVGYSLANSYLKLREPELALEVTKKLIPRNVEAYKLSAVCYQMLGDVISIRESYYSVLKLDPDDLQVYRVLARMFKRNQILDSTEWAVENIVRLDQGNKESWNELGQIKLALRQPQAAAEAFEKSIRLDSTVENLFAMIGLADSYQMQDSTELLILQLKKVHQLVPDNPLICSRIIATYTSQNRFAEATVYGRKMVGILPDDFDQQRRLGMIYFYADSLTEANVLFDALLEQGDVSSLTYHFLGLIATRAGEHESARDHFITETELDGESVDGWAALAFCYRNLGEIENSVLTYQSGLRQVLNLTDSIQMAYALGATFEELDQLDSAVAMFEAVLSWDSTFHQAMNYLGYMLADRNVRLDYSLKLLTQAIAMEPDNTAYLDSYGWAQYRLGNFELALEYLKRAAELDSDPVMFDHLGDALSANGDGPTARQWWQKALELDPENSAIKEKLEN